MDNMIITSSPHVRSNASVSRIMLDVVIALVPAAVAAVYYFKFQAALIIAIAVATAVVTEAFIQWLLKRPVTVGDWSAVITGLLVAFNLPPTAPWYIPFIGSIFAIVIVKQVFGGLGHNFMNPAAAARVFLVASFGQQMTNWFNPAVDAVSNATPLAIVKGLSTDPLPPVTDMLLGNHGGCLGETCAIALLLGGVYLLARRVITWHIPVAFIGTVGVLTFVFGPDGLFTGNVVYHLLGGGLLLGAVFMATDYVTSPVTSKGRLIMGFGCGVIVVVIRLLGGMSEGVAFSIILMNVATPLIDRWTRPRIYGEVKPNA